MRLSTLLPLVPLVAAAPATKRDEPAPLLVARDNSTVVPGKYIVKMKSNTGSSLTGSVMDLFPGDANHVYHNVFHGFAADLDENSLKTLRDHPDVDYIEPEMIVSASNIVQQNSATWGLSRISHRQKGFPEYVYDSSAGRGVCAYVIDTGVDDRHPEFEGRARMVASYVQGSNVDDQGHGTHVAGTIGSKTYGVAKGVNIYGIKVLRYDGKGETSAIIAGMDYVRQDVSRRSCPNGVVVNMSLGGGYSQATNDAARRLTENGYFVAVAAGNDNRDASYYSPASEPSVCTVGGTARDDTRYNMSNWGPAVNILGPAVDVYSTYPNGRSGLNTGTSMASPHIAGLAAYLATLKGQRAGPGLCRTMQDMATRGAITNQPSNTVNLLAFNGATN